MTTSVLRIFRAMLVALTLVVSAAAAEAPKKTFAIPANGAVTSLREFSIQSGQQLIYSGDAVEGVRTNAVKGEFTPRAALELMVAGTRLTVTQDRATGALAVTRASDPNAPRAVPADNNSAAAVRPPSTQSAAPGSAGAEKDDVVTLSPFNVRSERDTGFVAASSLAGGRLAGDLKDTPVAYSVITRDFIDALGLSNVTDAAAWTPNAVEYQSGQGGGSGDDLSNAPGLFKVRGSQVGRGQRNFFGYNSPMDSYAVERFDFSRGPNAILFGNGSIGGVATTMTKQARFDRAFGEISQRIGSFSDDRTTLDLNRPLGERAAVRLAAVDSHSRGWRKKQFSEIKALFLTTSTKLTSTTNVRLDAEYGEWGRNQTANNLTDSFSGWDGKTTFNGRADTLPANANALGVSRRGAGAIVWDMYSGLNAIMNYQNDPVTLGGGANNAVPIAGFLQGSLPSFGSSGSTILYAKNVPGTRFDNAIAGSAFRMPAKSFSVASDAPLYSERFRDLQLTVDQKLGAFFLQIAGDVNRTRFVTDQLDIRAMTSTMIDINRVLPNGSPNPHFLQPFGDGQFRRSIGFREINQGRFAVGYARNAGKWGNYSASVLGGISANSASTIVYNLSTAQNADHRRWGASSNNLAGTDLVRVRRYWNEESRPLYIPSNIRYVDALTGIDKTINPFMAVENDRNDSAQFINTRVNYAIAAVNAKYFQGRLVLLGAVRKDSSSSNNRQQIWAGDYSATSWDGVTPVLRPAPPADWATLMYYPKGANGVITGPLQSADTRPRDTNGTALPQYANDRFKTDYNSPALSVTKTTRTIGTVLNVLPWLGAIANYAETFNFNSPIQRIDGSLLPPTVSKGVDVGFRAQLFNKRMVLTLTRYTSTEANALQASAINAANLVSVITANKVDDLSASGTNQYNLPSIPTPFNDLADRRAEGLEFEVVANMTKQWRLLANFGLPKLYLENAYPDERRFFSQHLPTLRKIMADAGAVVDANDAATLDPNIANLTVRSPDVTSAVNAWNTMMLALKNAASGRRLSQDQRSVNVFSDYTLAEGRLRGLRVGLGVQYRGRLLIGYRAADTIVDPTNSSRAIDDPAVDAYTPVYSPNDYYLTNATLGYTVRLKNRRELRFDLRANNLLNQQGPLYSGSPVLRPLKGDYASPARETVPNLFNYREPFTMSLTTTLKF